MNLPSEPLTEALRALPAFDPPANGWQRVQAQLRLRPRPRRPALIPLAAAATLGVLAVGLSLRMPSLTGAGDTATPVDTAPWALAAAALALHATPPAESLQDDLDAATVTVTAQALLSAPDDEDWL